MAEMTSRERVWAALNHQEPDRVPLDIGGGASTTIIEEGYENLKQRWGVESDPKLLNKIFRMARLDESVMQRLGSDCRPLGLRAPVNWTPPPAEPGKFTDIWGITWKQAHYGDGCYYWELDNCPMAEASVEDIETIHGPTWTIPGSLLAWRKTLRSFTRKPTTPSWRMADSRAFGSLDTCCGVLSNR